MTPNMRKVMVELSGLDGMVHASELQRVLGMSHSDTYEALVALESRQLARVVVDSENSRKRGAAKKCYWVDAEAAA